MPEDSIDHIDFEDLNNSALSQPLVRHIYTADPSAHYFDGSWEEFVEQLGVLAENVRNQTLQQYRDQKIIELFSMFSTISNYFDERSS